METNANVKNQSGKKMTDVYRFVGWVIHPGEQLKDEEQIKLSVNLWVLAKDRKQQKARKSDTCNGILSLNIKSLVA